MRMIREGDGYRFDLHDEPPEEADMAWWETECYGPTATKEEQAERITVVMTLLHCHRELVGQVRARSGNEPLRLLTNEACLHLLNSMAELLHSEREIIQPLLLDIPEGEQRHRVRNLVMQIRTGG